MAEMVKTMVVMQKVLKKLVPEAVFLVNLNSVNLVERDDRKT